MSYLVLARKWRPDTFATMVGQEHVLQALVNSLSQQRLHHAYLFTGTRGVGKTTLARILAKAFNCEQSISAEPCGKCQTCQDIVAGRCVDLIEIDAASRTKVEDTREILDNVQYAPTRCRFKIYLIDEVHMLSGHSFNALLKTLEEPPSHVKFILATTDPQKLPITVLSRCLQFNLKNLLPEQISDHLAHILQQENIIYQKQALNLIARAAEGSMRDALSLLDQAIAYSSQQLEESVVRQMLGYIEHQHISQLLAALAAQDPAQLLAINRNLLQQGADFYRVLAELLEALHQITLLQLIPNCELVAAESHETLQQLATQFSAQDIQLFYQIALKGRQDLTLAPTPLVGFDMVMLRMLAFKPITNISPPQLAQQPAQLSATVATNHVAEAINKATTVATAQPPATPSPQVAQATDIEWEAILPKLKLTGIAQNIIQHCTLLNHSEQHITLALEPGHQAILTIAIRQRVEEAIQQYFQKKIKVNFEVVEDKLASPARKQQQADQQRLSEAKQALANDDKLNKIVSAFDGKLLESTLESS